MLALDGFCAVTQAALENLANNFERNINEFSPFAVRILPGPPDWIVDSFFGQVYSGLSLGSKGIYGTTDEIPNSPGDKLANAGYLRVPFRKIPRIVVSSRAELSRLVDAVRRSVSPDQELLFRGQHTEHTLARSKQTNVFLYGVEDEREPSLLASAVRRGVDLDEFALAWTCLLKIFYAAYIDEIADVMPASERAIVFESYKDFHYSYEQELFSLALAQHYGLPSVGLDLTTRLDIALFFAFYRFVRAEERSAYAHYERIIVKEELPVLYALIPQNRFQLDYAHLKPKYFPTTRPDAQHARFMHTGWGLNRNYAAKRIVAAFYLALPEPELESLPTAADLFPSIADDPFAQFLMHAREALPTKLLDPFYALS
jgi:hypothetical protein